MTEPSQATLERRGLLFVAGAALLWSTGGLGIKAVEAPALVVSFYRSAIAAVALFLVLRPRIRAINGAFFGSIVCYAGCLTTFVMATKWTTAANAIFLQYSGVIWVLVLSPLVLDEKMQRRDAIAVGVAFAGMALFFAGRFESRGLAGSLIAIVSGIFFSGIFIFLRLSRHGGSEAAVTWGNVLAAFAVLPWAAPHLAVSAKSLAILVFLGLVQIAAAYWLLVKGLAHVTATQASLMGMLEPIANPLWVFLAIGERPSPQAAAGGLVVLGAIAWRTLMGGSGSAARPESAPPA